MAAEKKVKKEIKSQHKPTFTPDKVEIEPPRLHRDMRLICDCFRISEQSRYRLREWDAASLEDFCLMTDEDFADFIVSSARINKPIPPLQQRKLRVLLVWVRTLVDVDNLSTNYGGDSEEPTSPNNNDSIDESNLKERDEDGALKSKYKTSSPRKRGGTFVKATWEEQFYRVRFTIYRMVVLFLILMFLFGKQSC